MEEVGRDPGITSFLSRLEVRKNDGQEKYLIKTCMKNNNLEDRLVEYAYRIVMVGEGLPKSYSAEHLGKQLIRSGTSAALNYGEAQGAESRIDFIHKFKLSAKELRETFICLKIIKRLGYLAPEVIDPVISETDELIAIFVAGMKTARKNLQK